MREAKTEIEKRFIVKKGGRYLNHLKGFRSERNTWSDDLYYAKLFKTVDDIPENLRKYAVKVDAQKFYDLNYDESDDGAIDDIRIERSSLKCIGADMGALDYYQTAGEAYQATVEKIQVEIEEMKTKIANYEKGIEKIEELANLQDDEIELKRDEGAVPVYRTLEGDFVITKHGPVEYGLYDPQNDQAVGVYSSLKQCRTRIKILRERAEKVRAA